MELLTIGDDAVSVEELKSRIGHEKELCLIVPDGTFSGARRMLKRYPHNCLKGDCFADQNLRQDVAAVALSSQSVLEGKKNSFLYPVRKYGGSEEDTGRCGISTDIQFALSAPGCLL